MFLFQIKKRDKILYLAIAFIVLLLLFFSQSLSMGAKPSEGKDFLDTDFQVVLEKDTLSVYLHAPITPIPDQLFVTVKSQNKILQKVKVSLIDVDEKGVPHFIGPHKIWGVIPERRKNESHIGLQFRLEFQP